MEDDGRIRVLAADDHPLIRAGLESVVGAQPDMALVAEASSGEEAVELYTLHRPDVVLMDLRMPGMGGTAAIRAIVGAHPAARVVALTTYDGDEDIYRALHAGACGYLLKEMMRTEVVETIRAAHAGRRTIPPAIAARLAEHTPRVELTDRELEVLRLMAAGLSNREIGDRLHRTEGTVKVHVKHVLEKLGTGDRTAAVTIALHRGIIHLHEAEPRGA